MKNAILFAMFALSLNLFATPVVNGAAKAGTIDPATLTAKDWASWPEVSIPTVAEVQATCFDVEKQCRRSGTASAICAKEKRACLAPTTM